MPQRVGHITAMGNPRLRRQVQSAKTLEELRAAMIAYIDNLDGRVRARNDTSGEEWGGRLIVMGGGMVCFDTVDEGGRGVEDEIYHPEETTKGPGRPRKQETEQVV